MLAGLRAKKSAVVAEWLRRTLETYPQGTARFLAREEDPFRNPVGHALRETLPALVDELAGEPDDGRLDRLLGDVVRIRAVQGFTAAQTVAFVFLLREVTRDVLRREPGAELDRDGLATLDARIDRLALRAFDVFVACRERLREVKAADARRRTALGERMEAWRARQAAAVPDSAPPPGDGP